MKLIIVSGLSGSGKSVALNVLEDMDYYCADNLPVTLLPEFAKQITSASEQYHGHAAVGIDARNISGEIEKIGAILQELKDSGIESEILYLEAEDDALLKRFSETRRKHPLSGKDTPLAEAIKKERKLLAPLASHADLRIDTTMSNVHQLRDMIRERITGKASRNISILFQSFAFKNGLPRDADFVFDARCLPNPHWIPELRPLTGLDKPVADYLADQAIVSAMFEEIRDYIDRWIPFFEAENRSYITVAIGCTGGHHRSVYLVNNLAQHFSSVRDNVQSRHRELQ